MAVTRGLLMLLLLMFAGSTTELLSANERSASECSKPYISRSDWLAPVRQFRRLRVTLKCHIYTMGGSATGRCAGANKYSVAWYKDGQRLHFGADRRSTLSRHIRLLRRNQLRLLQPVPQLNGTYSCRIANSTFYPGNCSHSLSCYPREAIRHMPVMVQQQQQQRQPPAVTFVGNATVCVGDRVELRCSSAVQASVTISSCQDAACSVNSSVIGRYDPSKQVTHIGGRQVLLQSRTAAAAAVAVRLSSVSHSEHGAYVCTVTPLHKDRFTAVNRTVFVRVSKQCGLLAAATAGEAGCSFACGIGIVSCLLLALAVGVGVCAVLVTRRAGAPVVKRLVVASWHDNQLYDAHQAALAVPEISVQRISPAASSRVCEENREVRYILPSCHGFEVDRKRISYHKVIGEGAFGCVHAGQLHNRSGCATPVAIKRLKTGHTEEELIALLKEIEVMKLMHKRPHPNIVGLVGVCTKRSPLLLLTELAQHGNLRDFLLERRPAEKQQQPVEAAHSNLQPGSRNVMVMPLVPLRQLLAFALDVASGLEFLASAGIVHRDVAARNVLVAARTDGAEGLQCKLADFGLTRQTREKEYYRMLNEGKLPVRWLAPESLRQRIFTAQSDIWSFGVVLYELFSHGDTPYPSLRADRVADFVLDGGRNSWPELAPRSAYQLMLSCWQLQPSERPTAAEARRILADLLHSVVSQE